jgi:hypothetical protein
MPAPNENSGEGDGFDVETGKIGANLPGDGPENSGGKAEWVRRYLGGLILDKRGQYWSISLGRVAFVAILVQFFIRWNFNPDAKELPAGLLEVFGVLAAYVFGSKITSLFGDKIKLANPEK